MLCVILVAQVCNVMNIEWTYYPVSLIRDKDIFNGIIVSATVLEKLSRKHANYCLLFPERVKMSFIFLFYDVGNIFLHFPSQTNWIY